MDSQREPRRVPITELTDIFLWEEERKADKTGCIKVAGNLYEVDLELVGLKVLLRYDPFDLSVIHVWHNKKRYDNAGPVDQTLHYHGRVKPEKPQKQPVNSEEFSFFRAVEQRRRFRVIPGVTNICTGNSCARWARCRLSFPAKAKRLWSDAIEARSEQGDKSLIVVVDEVFAESTMAQIHAASHGIPRVINLICTQPLYDAAQRGHDVIEESQIDID
ncbi:MAG: Mu transposase C-terminal domain-containing protein [Dethiobacter sp.]